MKFICLIICSFTFIFWEIVDQVGMEDFLLKQILFVKEEDNGGLLEPWVSDDSLEQGFRLFHTILQTLRDKY